MDQRPDLLFVNAIDLCNSFEGEWRQIGSTTIFGNLLPSLSAGNRTANRIEH